MTQIKFFLIFVSTITISSPSAANDDIVMKGQKPKWHGNSPVEDLTRLCSAELDTEKKILVCNAAVSRYASGPLKSIPSEGKSQAQFLIEKPQTSPNTHLYVFGLHESHITLGRLALREGNLKLAKDELSNSVHKVVLTPALQTIGPRMTLAAELLERGEKQTVLDYLTQVEKIWTQNEDAKKKIADWRKEIASGKKPTFQ